jgi:hypothetical protein
LPPPASGLSPLRHSGNTPAPTPTGDYAPSLRSPWRAASVTARRVFLPPLTRTAGGGFGRIAVSLSSLGQRLSCPNSRRLGSRCRPFPNSWAPKKRGLRFPQRSPRRRRHGSPDQPAGLPSAVPPGKRGAAPRPRQGWQRNSYGSSGSHPSSAPESPVSFIGCSRTRLGPAAPRAARAGGQSWRSSQGRPDAETTAYPSERLQAPQQGGSGDHQWLAHWINGGGPAPR